LFAARQLLVPLLGIPKGSPQMFAVTEVRGDQTVIDTDDAHLRFVAAVQAEPRLLHVTTAVQLKGWRGRLYFLPVRFLHDQITRSMMQVAARKVDAA
jgi:hypothetical protein